MYVTTLHIEGMMCPMCETHINETIRKNFSVNKVSSSHGKNTTCIQSDEKLDEEALRSAIAETGYELKGIKVEEQAEKKKFSLFKR